MNGTIPVDMGENDMPFWTIKPPYFGHTHLEESSRNSRAERGKQPKFSKNSGGTPFRES